MGGSTAGDAALGWSTGGLSTIFGSPGTSPSVTSQSAIDPALQRVFGQATGQLSNMFNNPLAAVGPRQIMGESPQEALFRQMGISNLQAAIPGAGSMTGLETGASNFLGQTIAGNFLDPTQSPVYQSIANSIGRQANDASQLAGDQLNANFAGAGQFGGSSALLGERANLAQRTGQGVSDTLASYLMPLYQQQLGFQQNAVPQAMAFGNLQRQLPMNQLGLSQQAYGLAGIPRQFQQQQADEAFNAAQRARSAQLEPFSLLGGLMGNTPQANSIVQQSEFERIWLPLLAGAMQGGMQGITGSKVA